VPAAAPTRIPDVRFQKIGGRTLLIRRNRAFEIDEVGVRIWQLLDGQRPLEEVIDSLAREFDAPREVLACDCAEFLDRLRAEELVQ